MMYTVKLLMMLAGLCCLPLCLMAQSEAPLALVIHGGAGTILKKNMTDEQEAAYQQQLNKALDAGYAVLNSGGTSTDAVVAAIKVMEDSPLFNAGKGAVFTHEGTNELDASIMEGKTLNAGAVAGIKTVKNPITAALAVMDNSVHVMLAGAGAEAFAREQGLELVENSYFGTDNRKESLKRAIERENSSGSIHWMNEEADENWKHGTVGAVALDRYGNLAAGTSTGGMTNKKFGRIGDAPVIGAGTYADNASCAVSATGHGEYFIRAVVAFQIASRMLYAGEPLQKAAETVIVEKMGKMGGTGGVICLDAKGNIAMPFNTEGMYRGYIAPDGKREVLIYK